MNYIDIDYYLIISETSKAWKIQLHEPDSPEDMDLEEKDMWFPKSQCSLNNSKKIIRVPDWLYRSKFEDEEETKQVTFDYDKESE